MPALDVSSEGYRMIDALITGRLHGQAERKVGNSGKPFVVAKVRTPINEGEAIFVSIIAFAEGLGESLLALDAGDSVSLSGALTPKVWQPANGEPRVVLDLVAHAAITAYHVTRKRAAAQTRPVSNSVRAAPMAPLSDVPKDLP